MIEGDEYDTCFFDKESKFLHYYPDLLVINNLEYDHADIFKNIDAIKSMFKKLLIKVRNPQNIIANIDSAHVYDLLTDLNILDQATTISSNKLKHAKITIQSNKATNSNLWSYQFKTPLWDTLKVNSRIWGNHNAYNIASAIAVISQLIKTKSISMTDSKDVVTAIQSFAGVQKRLDYLGSYSNINIFEDFAHHPTAVKQTILTVRKAFPKKNLIVIFEPKNASSRRNVFEEEYLAAFALSDKTLLACCQEDTRIPREERMDTFRLAAQMPKKIHAFSNNGSIKPWILENTPPNSCLVFYVMRQLCRVS